MSDFPPVEPKIVAKPVGYRPPTPTTPPKENGFGIAGLITAVLGLISCGSISVFAVILSAIGLRKEPRGLATAGFLLGLVGIVELIVVGFLAIAFWRTTAVAIQGAQEFGAKVQLNQQAILISEKWAADGELPSQEAGDKAVEYQRDVWGNPIEYETDEVSFSLRSTGPDGISLTEDDVVVGPFSDPQEATKDQLGFDPTEFENSMDQMQSDIEKEMQKIEQKLKDDPRFK